MRLFDRFILITSLFVFHMPGKVSAQQDFKVFTSDVSNFWIAMDSLEQGVDTIGIFQRMVIDQASEPFKIFIRKSGITARSYYNQVKKFPGFFKSIRESSLRLISSEHKIRTLVREFQGMYPGLVLADICIGFGNFQTGGTIHADGKTRIVYIGLEYHGLDSSANLSEFGKSMNEYLSRSNFFRTVIHELVHVQQATHGRAVRKSYYGDKLIHSVLREGVAEFIARLIYPDGNDGIYFDYGLRNEALLRVKIRDEMWQSDRSYWIYNSLPPAGVPADLGYFIGCRIAEAYFKKHGRKDIRDVIEIRDISKFIDGSGYFD